jgi:malate dehydrogenase (quinone)
MLDVLRRCFPERMPAWEPELKAMIPSFGRMLSDDPAAVERIQAVTARALGLIA